MSEEQQSIALESDEDDKGSVSSDPNVLSFRDEKEFQAYLAANPTVKKNLYGDI